VGTRPVPRDVLKTSGGWIASLDVDDVPVVGDGLLGWDADLEDAVGVAGGDLVGLDLAGEVDPFGDAAVADGAEAAGAVLEFPVGPVGSLDQEDAVVDPGGDLLGVEAGEVDGDDVAVLDRLDADVGVEPVRGGPGTTVTVGVADERVARRSSFGSSRRRVYGALPWR
jgi:hypothetical protein